MYIRIGFLIQNGNAHSCYFDMFFLINFFSKRFIFLLLYFMNKICYNPLVDDDDDDDDDDALGFEFSSLFERAVFWSRYFIFI